MIFTFAFMGLNGKLDRSSVWYFLVVLTMMSFPWNSHLNSIGIILLVLHWLLDEKLLSKIRSFRISPLILACWTYFFIHILYLIGTEDLQQGIQTIQVKLVFFILPILFTTESHLTIDKFRTLMFLFIYSCFGAMLFNLGHSIWLSHQFGFWYVISRMNLAYTIWHPGILSNYYCIGFFFMVLELVRNRNLTKSEKWICWIGSIFFLVFIFLLISKTNIIILVVFMVYLLWLFSSFIKNIIIRIGLFAFLGILLITIISFIPTVKNRIKETRLSQVDQNIKLSNSTGTRIVAYSSEWEIIKRNWILGYGTGDSNDLLKKELAHRGFRNLVVDGMNTHNQVLRSWIEFGLLGLVSLVAFWFFAVLELINKRYILGMWTLALLVINSLTDDILEVQAGSVFFMFTLSLLLFSAKPKVRTYH